MAWLRKALICVFVLTGVLACSLKESAAQNASKSDSLRTGVVLTKLSQPIYPRAAKAAHIVGDVDLMLTIRQDGSIESAVVVSGHPLLSPAALDSALHTQFECRKCGEAGSSYRLVYTFQIEGESGCEPTESAGKTDDHDQTYPQIIDAENRVTTVAYLVCIIDWAPIVKKRRSLRCLYLWRCGS